MTLDKYLKRQDSALKKKTLYVQGGWGQPLTEKNKVMFTTNPRWPYNQRPERKAKIMAASNDTIAVDCICGQKSIIDDLFGVDNQTTAMRKPCPDITVQALMNLCSNVRDVSYNKEPNVGDFLAYANYTHCGVYLGNGKVSEATHTGSDGLQIRDYAGRGWKWAGKLPYIENEPEPVPVAKVWAVQVMANKAKSNAKKYLRKGQSTYYVDGYYKNAYVFANIGECEKAISDIRKKYPDAFITNYDANALVIL